VNNTALRSLNFELPEISPLGLPPVWQSPSIYAASYPRSGAANSSTSGSGPTSRFTKASRRTSAARPRFWKLDLLDLRTALGDPYFDALQGIRGKAVTLGLQGRSKEDVDYMSRKRGYDSRVAPASSRGLYAG